MNKRGLTLTVTLTLTLTCYENAIAPILYTYTTESKRRATEVQHTDTVYLSKRWSPYCSQMFSPPNLIYTAQIRFGDLGSQATAISILCLPDFMALGLKVARIVNVTVPSSGAPLNSGTTLSTHTFSMETH